MIIGKRVQCDECGERYTSALSRTVHECPDCHTIERENEFGIPEGDVDHDEEDRQAYNAERNERPKPSEY